MSVAAHGWEDYWRGTLESPMPEKGGVTHPIIAQFWRDRLSELVAKRGPLTILDIGCGDGAVLRHIAKIEPGHVDRTTCVDVSESAIELVKQEFPSATAIVADARDIPLRGEFDLIMSQFGMEYAGPGAFSEGARLTRPGGSMLLLLHKEQSVMHEECIAAIDAINRLNKAHFIPLARSMFQAGFDAIRGGDRCLYDDAAASLNPAVRAVEEILTGHGKNVASGTIMSLYEGVARIHGELAQYEASDVIEWLRAMELGLVSFSARMRSMVDAALSRDGFSRVCNTLEECGMQIDQEHEIRSGQGRSLCWAVQATASP